MSQKGVSLYLAVMLMTILLATALGLAAILFSQLRTVRFAGRSVIALCAADTGIERALYVIEKQGVLADLFGQLGEAQYEVRPEYESGETYLKAVGIYKGTRRAVRIRLLGESFPRVENAFILPPSAPPYTIFTIQADILGVAGESGSAIDTNTTIAHIQNPDESDIATSPLELISGDAFSGTYQANWDSSGAPVGAYWVDIVACNLLANCREVENVETTVP